MKRTAMTIVCLALCGLAMAQKEVESPIVTEKDFVWYTEQKSAWQEAVRRNPQDEHA